MALPQIGWAQSVFIRVHLWLPWRDSGVRTRIIQKSETRNQDLGLGGACRE
jgi:hypothetical protein